LIKKKTILRIIDGKAIEVEDSVVAEHSLTIYLNSQQVVNLLCSPVKLDYMAIGFLLNEGYISTKEDILKTEVKSSERSSKAYITTIPQRGTLDNDKWLITITSSGGKYMPSGTSREDTVKGKIESAIKIKPAEITALVEQFHRHSPVFVATGGVHSVALCDNENILVFSDDIGRHNAMDRTFGECLMKDIKTTDRIVITSGRVSSEIMNKVARRNVPVLLSVSAPTDVAVELADSLGITLVGFVRGNKMNIYTHSRRVLLDDR
jgi:FdhD protein